MSEDQRRHGVPVVLGAFIRPLKHPFSRIKRRVSRRRMSNMSTASTSSTSSATTDYSTSSNSSGSSNTLYSSTQHEVEKNDSVDMVQSQKSRSSADEHQEYLERRRRKPQRPDGEPQRIRDARMNELKLRIVLERTFGDEGKKVPIWMQEDHYEVWPPRPLEAEDFRVAGFMA